MSEAREKRVRYAVVGAGNIAQVAVLPAFEHAHENSQLAAIVSGDPEKRGVLGARYGVATCGYDDLEATIARERIDALYITLPNTRHREFVERAARTRTHVRCEKPMAMTSEDCEAMVTACEAAGVQLMLAYRLHFEEANLRAMEIVRAGRIGRPRYFSASFSQRVREGDIRTRSESGGGALFLGGTRQAAKPGPTCVSWRPSSARRRSVSTYRSSRSIPATAPKWPTR